MIYTVEKRSLDDPPLDPRVQLYRHPVLFYSLATAIPWALWLIAGYISHQPTSTANNVAIGTLGFAGLLAPVVVATVLVWPNPVLRHDFARRLVNFSEVPLRMALLAALLSPGALLVATAFSIPLGYSPEQFGLRGGVSFTSVIPAWLLLGLAPLLEELAWHGYGTDALASRLTVFKTSMIFAVIWAVWHLPLAAIKGYYQAEVVETGWLASANFLLSIFPFVILMNWIYYRSGRNILIAFLFHFCSNYGNEIFLTHPDTKAIQTVLFLVLSLVVLWRERALFFSRPERVTW